MAALAGASAASAQSFLANKKFSASQAYPGSTVDLTFDLFNSRAETLSAGLQDKLPDTSPAGQLWFSTTDTAVASGVTGCTAGFLTFSDFLDAPANTMAQTVTISGATVPPQPAGLLTPNCQVTLPVHVGNVSSDSNVTNSVAEGIASATNANSDVFSSDAFAASLLIKAPVNPLAVTKAFAPAVVPAGGTSVLTITIKNNTSPAAPAANVAFTDTLPTGMTVAGVPSAGATCGVPNVSAIGNTVSMSGGAIAAGATCTIQVPVTATGNGALVNTIPVGGVTATGYSNTVAASGTLNVRDTIKITKTIQSPANSSQWRTDQLPSPGNLYGSGASFTQGKASAMVGQPVPVRVYFSNPSATPLTGGSLTDALPASIIAVGGAASGTCTWATTAPSIAAGATTVTLNGFSVPAANPATGALGSCYVEFWVKATATFTNNTNALSTSSVNFSGVNSNTIDAATSATMDATAAGGNGAGAVTVEKRFYKADGTNQTGTTTPIRVDKGEVFWMRVAVRNTVYDASYANGTVVDTLPLGLKVVNPPVVRLLQNPPTGNQSYPEGCGNQSASADATDGMVTVNTVGGQDVVTYSGWTLHSGAGANNTTAKNQGCFYAVQLVSDVTGYPGGGDYINTISANTVTASANGQPVTNPSGVSARVVVRSDLDAAKAFNPSTIGSAGGGKTRLTITFNNKNSTAITNLAVTDPLPSSAAFGTLTVATPANVSNTCGGNVAANPGATSVALAGGTVAPNGSCSIEVDVLHSGGDGNTGTITNTIAKGGVTNDQGQSNNEDVTATLTKGSMGVNLNKQFAVSQALGGRAVQLTLNFNATTASTLAQDLITVTDNLPSGMEVAPNANIATTCLKQNGDPADVTITPTRNAFTISGFRFEAYSNGAVPTNSCTLTLDVIMTTTGNKTNTIAAKMVGTDVGSTNPSSTSSTLSALVNTSLQKQFSPKRVEVGSPSTMTLTVVNVNTEARTDFSLTDTLPAGMIVAAGASSHTCGNGVLTAAPGSGSVAITGGDVGGNASCTITVPVTVTAAGGYENGPGNISATNYIDTSEARDELEGYASSLRGTVFVDPDLNGGTTGFVPAADTGLGGVTMELLRNGTVVATAVTAAADLAEGETFTNTVNGAAVSCTVPAGGVAAGQYLFCNLPSGTDYAVRETQPAGYTSTGNKAGTAGGAPGALGGATELIETITVRPEENESGYDFGEYEQGITNVSGRVYAETGNNAIDPGLVTTVAITCTGPGDAPAYSNSMTTNADGTYSFTGMLPGAQCQITETQPVDYSNAYTQTGMTGEPGALGPVDASEYGNPGDSVIASIVVPAAGSPYNNFAEIRLADMSSTTVCTPTKGMPGTVVSCTVTCTNAGPNSAANAFCSVPNAPSLPGSPAPVCENSPAALLGMGESLACTVSFKLPNTAGTITVQGGTGADNDTNGSSVPTEGNNPSGASVAPQILAPVPTLGEWTIMFMMALLAGLGATRLRRR